MAGSDFTDAKPVTVDEDGDLSVRLVVRTAFQGNDRSTGVGRGPVSCTPEQPRTILAGNKSEQSNLVRIKFRTN